MTPWRESWRRSPERRLEDPSWEMLLADPEQSVEMQPGDLEKKFFWFRLGTRLARLTAPVQ